MFLVSISCGSIQDIILQEMYGLENPGLVLLQSDIRDRAVNLAVVSRSRYLFHCRQETLPRYSKAEFQIHKVVLKLFLLPEIIKRASCCENINCYLGPET